MESCKRKAIICIYSGAIGEQLSILEKLDKDGFEVHLFDNIELCNFKMDILPEIIKNVFGNKAHLYEIYVSSNIKEFMKLQTILYKNYVAGYLYINDNPVEAKINELEKAILSYQYNQPIKNFYITKKDESLNFDTIAFDGKLSTNNEENCDEVNYIYIYNGEKHVFAVKEKIPTHVINLDDSESFEYNYHFGMEYLDEYLEYIRFYSNSIDKFIESNGKVFSKLSELTRLLLNLGEFEKNLVNLRLDNELNNNLEIDDRYEIFLSSTLLDIFKEDKYLVYLLKLLIESKQIDKYNRYFAYCQCERYAFVNKSKGEIRVLLEKLYNKVFSEFMHEHGRRKKILKENRDPETIIIITDQFLGPNHSPTKVALDFYYNLAKKLKKKVILLNTREVLTRKGMLAFGTLTIANLEESYNGLKNINYNDTTMQVYQSAKEMPDSDEIEYILNQIENLKPYMIINIGTSLVGEICTSLVPTVTIPLGSDGYANSTFYVVSDEKLAEDYCKSHERDFQSMIVSQFAFELKKNLNTLTRQQLSIPENKFVLCVIGNRLNDDINDELLDMLDKSCVIANAYVVFINEYKFNSEQTCKYQTLINNSKSLGYFDDLISVVENIDLYINPDRIGGGTSALYALHCGKPVLTLNKGDVYTNAGDEFGAENYTAMLETISRYQNDEDFYIKKSVAAKNRAAKLEDTFEFVNNILKKVIDNPMFK